MKIKVIQIKRCFLLVLAIVVGHAQPIFSQQTDPNSTSPAGTTSSTATTTATDTSSGAAAAQSAGAGTVDQGDGSGVIPSGGGSTGGALNFQADLFTGRFAYSIPIKVAPGRQGAQPQLTLGYNSATGNGWCGVGWTLDTGYIQRDVRKGVPLLWAPGYTSPLPQYDDTKGFTANFGGVGGALVLVGSTNQNPIVYRQQVDTTYLTYNYYANNHWEVVDKSGNTFYFGEGSTNQMENSKAGWVANTGSSTFRWALDRVVDVNGNETFLRYATDGGALYLTNIMYNANINSPALAATHEVDFILTNRSDTTVSFINGYRVQMQKLLSEIDVKVSGSNVRKYVLNYTASPSTTRSLISSVTEYGSDYSTALPPITFNYQVQSQAFMATNVWTGMNIQGINGINATNSWNCVRAQSTTDGYFYVSTIDIDGDGIMDRVMRQDFSPYGNFLVLNMNTGTNFSTTSTNYQWGKLDMQGGSSTDGWNSPTAINASGYCFLDLLDINGDGYPDRVMEQRGGPYTNFVVELNSGIQASNGGFAASVNWGPVTGETTGEQWGCLRSKYTVDFIDINGDGLPDRVMRKLNSPYDRFRVQLNTGRGFTGLLDWTNVSSQGDTTAAWNTIASQDGDNGGDWNVVLQDINGDGLPDRVMRQHDAPYTTFIVQYNNGAGFEPAEAWGTLDNQGLTTSKEWNSPIGGGNGGVVNSTMVDINGDGLPDRVMVYDDGLLGPNFHVQLNTGSGLGPSQYFNGIYDQGGNPRWDSISYQSSGNTSVDFLDINGDGLPDRVMQRTNSPDRFLVQLSQGPFPDLLNAVNNGIGGSVLVSYVASTTLDNRDTNWVNDRWTGKTRSLLPFNTWVVSQIVSCDGIQNYFGFVSAATLGGGGGQNYLVGDILTVTGGVGAPAQIRVNSVKPGGAINTYSIYFGGQYTTLPGIHSDPVGGSGVHAHFDLTMTAPASGTFRTNSFAFKGGYYNSTEKEFRGFSQAMVTDPLGTKSITYFHQSGGRDNSALGEYQDQFSESKKGIPYRIEIIGNDGSTNKITLNKVQEVLLNSNGWYFPFISQSIVMNYEGLSSYRAVAKQFGYDTNTENLLEEADLGEVTNVLVNGQTFTDVGSDSVYTWMTYTNLGKPSDIKITSDSAGANRLRETLMSYDSRGSLTGNQVWLDTAGSFITKFSTTYDQYGNPIQTTDASGITTTTVYDSTLRQYPVTQITATFTNQFAYDLRVGLTLLAVDAKGLVASNAYDVFYRNTASYISTNAYGSPTLWKTKISYSLGGISNAISYNYVHKQVNDAVDLANGFETYTYLDGMGRTIQTRTEAETGQFRVANPVYDKRGNAYFQTLPYFSSGMGFTVISGTYLGTLTEYDSIGRSYRATPAVQGTFTSGNLTNTSATGGDTGSPVGAAIIAFADGNNPWVSVVTDSEGKVKRAYRDAYGRTTQITEVTSLGNCNTSYNYDLLGNLTNVTDNANNSTIMAYDSLGRKTSMTDLDMGTWSYAYDNAGRVTQQVDARTNKLTFTYSDQLGRLTSKQIYNAANSLVGMVTYIYDISDDTNNYTVLKGQLYKVTDLQGWQRSSYDVRGRVVKTGRFLSVNTMEYVTQTTYDDADRVQTIIYPGNAATIKYAYDTAGNLIQVKSLAGTGTQESVYTPGSFNALGQLTAYTDGAGVVTTNVYFANSKRLQNVSVKCGTNSLQNLSYTYDSVSDIKSIGDNVYSGSASASISSVSYDDLYRVTSVNSTARGVKSYGYNSIGNVLTNADFGSGLYSYGTKPHAVTSANGASYGYDACGNMTTRGNQTLTYDEQNELTRVATTNGTVMFGYDDAGERLWRCGTNGYSVWIGGIYEINNGKVLCHVFAGGKRLATFEPQCGGLWSKAFGEKNWYVASTKAEAIFNWPFQNGRGQWTMFGGTWVVILGVCMMAGRKVRLKRYEVRKAFRQSVLWKQAVTLVSISAFLWASSPETFATPVYGPVFYYYHNDNLGSSNVLTNRSGQMVQHYEYATFGQSFYQDNTSAYQVSNRYTGQICDDETGLYYYGSRYYDSQLGRFIQADTVVPSTASPQTLNRYSYCGNNPLKYLDPTGHAFGIDDIVVAVIVGGALGGATAGATGGNIGLGILTGALGGLVAGIGIWAGTAIGTVAGGTTGATIGGCAGAIAGGAAAGTVNAELTGGDIGLAALSGAIAGGIAFGVGYINANILPYRLPDVVEVAVGSALGGGIGSTIQGGDFLMGAALGAAVGIAGYYSASEVVKLWIEATSPNLGKGGELTINANTTPSGSTIGGQDIGSHAWLKLAQDNGLVDTYGTWSRGTGPEGGPGGLRFDEELNLGEQADASKTVTLSPGQVTKFNQEIRMYNFFGERAWTITSPCSSFACNVWNGVTGQSLSAGFISTPANLGRSIQSNP